MSLAFGTPNSVRDIRASTDANRGNTLLRATIWKRRVGLKKRPGCGSGRQVGGRALEHGPLPEKRHATTRPSHREALAHSASIRCPDIGFAAIPAKHGEFVADRGRYCS